MLPTAAIWRNRVEAPVVDALVSSVRSAYPRPSHRYYALKARWLGKERLPTGIGTRRCPISRSASSRGPRRERIVLKAYGAFAPEMAGIAKQFFDSGWIDAPVRPGKAPGAFSPPPCRQCIPMC